MRSTESGARHLSWEIWWAVAGSIVVFLAFIELAPVDRVADRITRGDRWDYLLPLLVLAAVIAAIALILHWRGKRDGHMGSLHRFLALSAPLIVLLALGIYGVADFPAARDWGENTVGNYCAWGAVSEAQFQGCVNNVSLQQVRGLDSQAARFAVDREAVCGSAPGIYCKRVEAAYDEMLGF